MISLDTGPIFRSLWPQRQASQRVMQIWHRFWADTWMSETGNMQYRNIAKSRICSSELSTLRRWILGSSPYCTWASVPQNHSRFLRTRRSGGWDLVHGGGT